MTWYWTTGCRSISVRFQERILGLMTLLLISATKLCQGRLWSPSPVITGSSPICCLELSMSQLKLINGACSLTSSPALWAQRNNLQKLIYSPLKIYTHFPQTHTMRQLPPTLHFSFHCYYFQTCSKWLSFFCKSFILYKWQCPLQNQFCLLISHPNPSLSHASPSTIVAVNWIWGNLCC